MPRPFNVAALFFYHARQLRQFLPVETKTVSEPDFRVQPKFCFRASAIDVNMDWLAGASFVGEKEKSRAAMAKNNWHAAL